MPLLLFEPADICEKNIVVPFGYTPTLSQLTLSYLPLGCEPLGNPNMQHTDNPGCELRRAKDAVVLTALQEKDFDKSKKEGTILANPGSGIDPDEQLRRIGRLVMRNSENHGNYIPSMIPHGSHEFHCPVWEYTIEASPNASRAEKRVLFPEPLKSRERGYVRIHAQEAPELTDICMQMELAAQKPIKFLRDFFAFGGPFGRPAFYDRRGEFRNGNVFLETLRIKEKDPDLAKASPSPLVWYRSQSHQS